MVIPVVHSSLDHEPTIVPENRMMVATTLSERLTDPVRQMIADQVTGFFNDRQQGQRPVVRRNDGLFGPSSVVWRVHNDVTAMLVGGIAGLLMQMLLPRVLAGVWDHSSFRGDMHGRLRRTARFLALTTFGGRVEAEAAIATVRRIHCHVSGRLPDGTVYSANDPALLAWVHASETTSFLGAWMRLVEPAMSRADQDRYFAEMAVIAHGLGADPVPLTHAAAWRIIDAMRGQLHTDYRTEEVAANVLDIRRSPLIGRPIALVMRQAAIDQLPAWARTLHGLNSHPLQRPSVRVGAQGLSRALRWAMRR